MYCKNCGKTLSQEENFCTNCGAKVENEINSITESNIIQNQFDINNQYVDNNVKKSNWKSTASLIIGIISLLLVFIFLIFTIPLSIIGIVFGIMGIKENKAGLVLNIISLVLPIPLFLVYTSLLGIGSNPALGTWDCKAFNNGYNDDLEYIVTMKLEENNKFIWSKYNDGKNNYVSGNYEFVDLYKTNPGGTANYYSITLIGDEYVNDGILQTEPYKSEYEMGIIKDADEAVLMNTKTYNIYYCHRNSK